MIYTYTSTLGEKDLQIRDSIVHFKNLYEYTYVNSLGTSGLSVREIIDRGWEIILSDAPTVVRIKFDHDRDKLELTIDHTVKAMEEIFSNDNRLIRKVGDLIKQNKLQLTSFELGSDGVILP